MPTKSDYIKMPCRPCSERHGQHDLVPGAPVIVSGDQCIQPDEDTRRAIGVSGIKEVTGSLEVCSDADGVPVKITLTRSTAYATYDRALADGARRWRFIPHQVRGEYVSSCTNVQLTYRPWRD